MHDGEAQALRSANRLRNSFRNEVSSRNDPRITLFTILAPSSFTPRQCMQ